MKLYVRVNRVVLDLSYPKLILKFVINKYILVNIIIMKVCLLVGPSFKQQRNIIRTMSGHGFFF